VWRRRTIGGALADIQTQVPGTLSHGVGHHNDVALLGAPFAPSGNLRCTLGRPLAYPSLLTFRDQVVALFVITNKPEFVAAAIRDW